MSTPTEALDQAKTELAADLERRGIAAARAIELASQHASRLTVAGDGTVRAMRRTGMEALPGGWNTQRALLAQEIADVEPLRPLAKEEQDRIVAQKHANVGYSI